MDRSDLWRWVRWLGLAFLFLSGVPRYELQAAWGAGPVIWSGTVGANGIEAAWSKDPIGASASRQGLDLHSRKRGRYEIARWVTWVSSPFERRIGAGMPSLIIVYLLACTTAHYTWQYRNRRLAKAPVAPTP